MPRAVVYGSACPACTQAAHILDRFGIEHERRPIGEAAAVFGRVRSMPRITIDGLPVGGIDDLLRLTRSGQLERIAAGEPYVAPPRRGLGDRLAALGRSRGRA
ncbi:MAG: glutaredoxin [Gaiellales bacterium]